MPINEVLIDSEGFNWDLVSGLPGLGIVDGENDTFDGGLLLIVNGTPVDPQEASVDEGGREVNAAPVLIGGIGVQRSILVSDAGISAMGYARFLDSFTNTTDSEQIITVSIVTDSGADGTLVLPTTTSGDSILTAADTGFTTDDGNPNGADSAFAYGYGDGVSAFSLPSSATQVNDILTVTYTLTLAPGETQSLLSFGTQSTTTNDANADLPALTGSADALNNAGLLAGLSREEQLTIVNYAGFDTLQDPFTLTDSEGHRWTIALDGTIQSADSGSLTDFRVENIAQNFTSLLGFSVDEATDTVTVVREFPTFPGNTATFDYTALPDQGVIRLLVTVTTSASSALDFPDFIVNAGVPNGANLVGQHLTANEVVGVVVDDSASGSGGTVPNATVIWGSIGPGDTASLSGSTLTAIQDGVFFPAGTTSTLLYYLALNDTGLAGLADLERFSTPGPQALIGLSAAEVAALVNFDLTEVDRLQQILGSDDVDDVILGHAWGDQITGGSGDDDIAAGGSDDVVLGGIGNDQIDGGDGADTLSGGDNDDDLTGGTGNDSITGDDGADYLGGQAGDDVLSGGIGNDRLIGASGADDLLGGGDNDILSGNTGNDTLRGENGFDDLFGGGNDDQLFGGDEIDFLFGGKGNDTLNGDNDFDSLHGGDGIDFLYGGEDGDSLFGGNGADSLFGGNGDDQLTGGAANETGINRMFGGQGSDNYFVTTVRDRVTEVANGTGTDRVFSDISFTLGNHIEQLTLNDGAALNATGNTLANTLTGNANANTLDGLGGADTMRGNLGDDTYVVDSAGDGVLEFDGTNEGIDTVRSTVTHTLAANVENLVLTGNSLVNGTGNTAANSLTGNAVANTLNGALGNDTLASGAGSDVFLFNTALGPDNIDHLTDFTVGRDIIQLDDAIFTGLALGRPAAFTFVNGTAALDANDRLLYDIATGTLRYDADGNGIGVAQVVAILDNNAALVNGSFLVI